MVRVVLEEVAMPLPDGTRLATEVAVADDGAPHPVLLVRTPYGRDFARGLHDPVALAREGWAVVLQDVRGRWGSEGAFAAFAQEGPDGAAAVEWCARQPWSNGRVATAGASYQGWTQWAAAVERPRGLCAISPAIVAPALGEGWFRQGGAFRVGAWTLWALGIASAGTGGSRASERRAGKALAEWLELVRHPTNVDAVAIAMPQFRDWLSPESELNAQPRGRLARVAVPGFHVGGWYDIFCEGTIAGYTALRRARSEAVRRAQRLVVGPWGHVAQYGQITGEVDFGPDANAAARGLLQEQLRFLRDAADGNEPQGGVSVFVMGRNRWLDLETWPPPAREVPLHLAADGASNGLHGGGRLQWSAPERSGEDRYRHDPADPVPTRGGRHLHVGLPPFGPLDQRQLGGRSDVLVYTSEPLGGDLAVVGLVRARLRFASTAARADVAVKLVDVHPDGRALNVVDSIRRVELVPGVPQQVDLDVGSTAMTFARGHRIRIEVASSNWPQFDLVEAAEQTLHWGGRSGSRLLLPVYEG
ncbi:MAG TPA: CocE/NonD family hydrolase [Gaiellaceae bacterium]|nr:CocE/NonD family hydrolase [Gaiellaceae bacterium]